MSPDTFPHGRTGYKKLGCHCDDCEFRRHQPGYVDTGCHCQICKDGQNEFITAQRNRKKNEGRKSARTRGRSVTRSGARPGATESTAERPERPRPASTPASPHGRSVGATDPGKAPERPESPAKRSRPTEGSDAPGWEMPRMWPVGEPSYAAGHRDYFAGMVSAVMANPDETRYVHITADSDKQEDKQSAKQEAKDFYRLIKAFRKRNPGLVQVQGSELKGLTYYAFTIYRDGYELTSDDEETTDDEQAESEIEETPESKPEPLDNTPQTRGRVNSLSYTFHKAFREGTYSFTPNSQGMCQIKLSTDETNCRVFVGYTENEWKHSVSGYPVCQDHYNRVFADYPERCNYKTTNKKWAKTEPRIVPAQITSPNIPPSTNNQSPFPSWG